VLPLFSIFERFFDKKPIRCKNGRGVYSSTISWPVGRARDSQFEVTGLNPGLNLI
jgi:hypothetical protein